MFDKKYGIIVKFYEQYEQCSGWPYIHNIVHVDGEILGPRYHDELVGGKQLMPPQDLDSCLITQCHNDGQV